MMGVSSAVAVSSSDMRRAVMDAAAEEEAGAKALAVPARAEKAMARESFMVCYDAGVVFVISIEL